MANSTYSGQAVSGFSGLVAALIADPSFAVAIDDAVAAAGGGTAGTDLRVASGVVSAAGALTLTLSDGSTVLVDLTPALGTGPVAVDQHVVSGSIVAPATLRLVLADATTVDVDVASIVAGATTHTLNVATWTVTSTVNGVAAIFTPAAGTIDQTLGFNLAGEMVRGAAPQTPETPLTVIDTHTIDFTAAGTNGHQITADLRIDNVTPGNVVFSSGVNGLKAAVTIPADLRVTGIAASAIPGHYTATLSDASTFDVDLTALQTTPATAAPQPDSPIALVGTSTKFAREDHAHPRSAPTVDVALDATELTVEIDGVTGTLAIPAGTLAHVLGFDSLGKVTRAVAPAPETALAVTGSDAIIATATGTLGHALALDLRIDNVAPGNVVFTTGANGLKATVAIPADVKVTGIAASLVPGHYTATLSDGTTFDVDLTALEAKPATVAPTADGTAAVGTSTKFAREDHVHPVGLPVVNLGFGAGDLTVQIDGVTATVAIPAGDAVTILGFDAVGAPVRSTAPPTTVTALTENNEIVLSVNGVDATIRPILATPVTFIGFNVDGDLVKGAAAAADAPLPEIGRGAELPTDDALELFIVEGSTTVGIDDGLYWRTTAGGWVFTNGVTVGSGGGSTSSANLVAGSGVPGAGVGADGDYFLDGASGTLYGPKAGGAWPGSGTVVGSGGTPTPEANLIAGTNPPLDAVGADGDYFLDALDGTLYGPKAAGDWPLTGNPVGASAADLNVIAGPNHPLDTVGADGDFYLDSLDGQLYGPKAGGTWPATGNPVGVAASSLNTITGSGAPDDAAGTDGDYYIDAAAATIYGPKAGGDWPLTGTPLGAVSNDPANLIAGTGAPAAGVGANGDYYLDGVTGTLYGPKAAGAWPAGSTLAADAANLIAGNGAPTAGVGANGDYYIDSATSTMYGPKAAGAWPAGTAVGTTDPANLIAGSGAPAAGVGANGDYYIDRASSTMYGPKAAGAWPAGTSVGAGLANVVEDLTPQLGGDLDANGHAITGATQISTDVTTLTGAAVTADIAAHGGYTINLAQNTTVTVPAGTAGVSRASTLRFVQDATGGRTVAWAGVDAWLGGQVPTIDLAANAETFVTVFQHGARTIGVAPITVDAGITGEGTTPPTALWSGTQAEYDAIVTKVATTVYVIR